MRIVLVGAVHFSRVCLEEILAQSGKVVAVLTLSPERAGFHADYADLAEVAEPAGVPVHRVGNVNDPETVALLRELEPDVIFTFGWSQIVKPEVLSIPPKGCIGTHPALLPRDRGRHPIVWALVDGRSESGLTFFYLDEGPDSGDILWQRAFPIALEEDAADVYGKVEALAREGIREFLGPLERGEAHRIPQDHGQATYRRKRGEEDGEIRWDGTALTAYNLVRALAKPYVGAHTWVDGERVLLWRADPPEGGAPCGQPGTVVDSANGHLKVATADGSLTITEYESPRALEPGEVLG
jgi:methionyl-tRNA formyltransferase